MSTARKCDQCESTYAMERADFPYPLTVTDDDGASAEYCSHTCVVAALTDFEKQAAYRLGYANGQLQPPPRKSGWFRR